MNKRGDNMKKDIGGKNKESTIGVVIDDAEMLLEYYKISSELNAREAYLIFSIGGGFRPEDFPKKEREIALLLSPSTLCYPAYINLLDSNFERQYALCSKKLNESRQLLNAALVWAFREAKKRKTKITKVFIRSLVTPTIMFDSTGVKISCAAALTCMKGLREVNIEEISTKLGIISKNAVELFDSDEKFENLDFTAYAELSKRMRDLQFEALHIAKPFLEVERSRVRKLHISNINAIRNFLVKHNIDGCKVCFVEGLLSTDAYQNLPNAELELISGLDHSLSELVEEYYVSNVLLSVEKINGEKLGARISLNTSFFDEKLTEAFRGLSLAGMKHVILEPDKEFINEQLIEYVDFVLDVQKNNAR